MKKSLTWLFIVIALISGVFWLNRTRNIEQKVTIKSDKYHAEFVLPEGYINSTSDTQSIIVLKKDSNDAKLVITLSLRDELFPDEKAYRDYVTSGGLYGVCDAEGPNSRSYCNKIVEQNLVRNDKVKAYHYILNLVHETYPIGQPETKEVEPLGIYDAILPSGALVRIKPSWTGQFVNADAEFIIKHLK